jgi:hypothetical protein
MEQMKPKLKLTTILFFLLALVLLAGCSPIYNIDTGGLVVGQSYRLRSDETLNEDLTVVGGSAELEEGSKVNGNVAILGGSLSINGEVTGDVNAMGGVVSVGDTAVIHGNIQTLGATVSRSENATILGSIGSGQPTVRLPGTARPTIQSGMQVIWKFISPIFQSFALAALAVLVSLFALRPMEHIGDAMTGQPFTAGGIGLLSAVVLPVMMVIISITIILLPVGLIGILALGLAFLFGWVSAGLVTGERLAQAFRQNWSGPVSAGVGTLALSLAAALVGSIPCIGWIAPFLVGVVGLGSVILTRFGLQAYPLPHPFIPQVPVSPQEPPAEPANQ